MGDDRSMLFPRASAKNLIHLFESGVTFFFPIVEMRREANTGIRPPIHEDIASEEFAADFRGMRAIYGDGPSALGGMLGRADLPAARCGSGHDARGEAGGVFARGGPARVGDEVEARVGSVGGGGWGGAARKTGGKFSGIDG